MQFLANILQRIPDRLRGKQRVARGLLGALVDRSKPIRVTADHALHYHLPNLQENVAFEIFINGIVEGETVAFLEQLLRSKANDADSLSFLDIGANIGGITLPLLKRLPTLQAICIEASPHVFSYLSKNIEQNQLSARANAIHLCLSDSQAESVDFFSPLEGFGKGSMQAVFTKTATRVANARLDDWLASGQRIDLIKIDVEGFESQVFRGAEKFLCHQSAPDIVFEVCDWAENLAGNQVGDSQRLLQKYGYRLARMETPTELLEAPIESGFSMVYATKSAQI